MKQIVYLLIMLCTLQTVIAQTSSTGLLWGTDLDKILTSPLPVRNRNAIPAKYSLEDYCPDPIPQGNKETCAGWAIGYAACSIIEFMFQEKMKGSRSLKPSEQKEHAISAIYVYEQGLIAEGLTTQGCTKPIPIKKTLEALEGKKLPLYSPGFRECNNNNNTDGSNVDPLIITSSISLCASKADFEQTKKNIQAQISKKHPVIASLKVCDEFWTGASDVWKNPKTFDKYHAVCIIGYDNKGFKFMNSAIKGKRGGFFTIEYKDLEHILESAYSIATNRDAEIAKRTQIGEIVASQIELKWLDNKPSPLVSMGLNRYKIQKTATYKDPFKIDVKFKGQPIYLYVLNSDDKWDSFEQIFPNPNSNLPMKVFSTSEFSDYKMNLRTDTSEYLFFLYSNVELPIDNLKKACTKQRGFAIGETIEQFFKNKDRLQPVNMKASTNGISFETSYIAGSVCVVSIALEHK